MDFYLYDQAEKTLYVTDLKYGYEIVEPFENWQALAYAAGVAALPGMVPDKVVITIVQPRAPHRRGPIRTWSCCRYSACQTLERERSPMRW